MKPRPIYRWKSFWLGLCVLVFLGWEWRRGMTHDEGVSFGFFDHSVGISAYNGYFGAYYNGITEVGLHWESSPREPSDHFHWPIQIEARKEGRHYEAWLPAHAHLFVFNWLVILLFSLVWCVWLIYHWKREQRKLNA